MRRAYLCFVMCGLTLAGCTTGPPSESFDRLRADLRERGGYETVWAPVRASPEWEALRADYLDDGMLGADEAVRLALLNNADLQAELDELGVAHAQLVQASLLPNPVLDASVRFVEGGGGEIFELGIAQNLVELLLLPRRQRRAEEGVALAEASAAAAVLDLAAETRTAYRRYQAQLARIELYQSVVDATRLAADMARRLRDAGNVIELDVLQEDAMYRDARLMLAEAQGQAVQRRESLHALLGVWGESASGWAVPARLPDPSPLQLDPAELVSGVIAASLDLEAQRRRINLLGQRLGIESFEALLPDLEAGAEAERESDGAWSVGPAVGVALPIFDTGRGVRAEYGALLRQAMNRYRAMAVRLRASARSSYSTAQTTANTSRYLREVVVPLRHRVTGQTQLQFNAMQLGVFRMLDAKRSEIQAAERYLTALENHWVARIELETLRMGRMPRTRYGIDPGGALGSGGESSTPSDNGDH